MDASEVFYTSTRNILIAVVPILIIYFGANFRALNSTLRALLLYLCFCSASDIICTIYETNEELKSITVNSFTIIEASILLLIYFIEFDTKTKKNKVIILFLIFLIIATYHFVLLSGLNQVDTIVSLSEAIMLLALSLLSLINFVTSRQMKKPQDEYFFWLVLSNLFYFSTALIFFAASSFIAKTKDHISNMLWGLHNLIALGCYILFFISLWKTKALQR